MDKGRSSEIRVKSVKYGRNREKDSSSDSLILCSFVGVFLAWHWIVSNLKMKSQTIFLYADLCHCFDIWIRSYQYPAHILAIVLLYLPRLLIQFCLTVTETNLQHPVGHSSRNEITGFLSIYSLQSKHSLDSEGKRTREGSRSIARRLRTESKAPWVARNAIE